MRQVQFQVVADGIEPGIYPYTLTFDPTGPSTAPTKTITHVVIVGFQSYGSLGRKLVEGEKTVSIFGERIPVRATVHTLNGFSGHADQAELLKWFSTLAPGKPKVFLTHGEDRGRGALAKLIQQKFKLAPGLPRQGEVIEI